MADIVESSDDEETNHGPADSIHSSPTAPQSSGSPVSKDEPESKRQRIQWLENVIDKVLGGFSDADKSLCDREKFKTMLSDLDKQWTSTLSRQTRRTTRKTRPARLIAGNTRDSYPVVDSSNQVVVAEVYSPPRMSEMADKLNMKS